MASNGWRVTYDVVTPESADHGDSADHGFVGPGGWHYPVTDPGPHEMSLREAMRLASPSHDAGRWFAEDEGRVDYRTGAEERRSIHPPAGITAASYARVARLLGCGR